MKKICFIILAISLCLQALSQDIILLHTNDLHSKLNGYSPEIEYTPLSNGDDMTMGGFARIAGLIKAEKEAHPNDIVLAIDAGDFMMGSLFHPLETETGFQLQLMKEMGYDYMTLGNHEFDYGPSGLAEIIQKAKQGNGLPQLLLSNIEFSKKDTTDDSLESLYNEGIIKKYHIHKEKGVRIAFIGIIGHDAKEVQPMLPPIKLSDPVKTAKKTAKELIKKDMADLVIVLSHSGVEQEKNTWTGEDVKLASKTHTYINAIISGHTHTVLDEPIFEKSVPIVQTGSGGINVGKLVFQKNNDSFEFKEHKLIPINDDIIAIKEIQDKIENQKLLVQHKLLDPLKITYDQAIFETSFDMECKEEADLNKSTLGPMVADAIHTYVTDAGYHSDMSLIAAGVIRDQLRKGQHGMQNISDIFRIASLGEGEDGIPGFALAQVYITAKELKSVLEILIMAQDSPNSFCYFSGVRITVDKTKGFLNKVQKIEMKNKHTDWTPLDYSKKNKKLYSVTANAYMLTFLNIIKQKSFGIVNVNPKTKEGNHIQDIKKQYIDFDLKTEGIQEGKEWMALLHLVQKFSDTNGNNIPDVPQTYRHKQNPIIILNE